MEELIAQIIDLVPGSTWEALGAALGISVLLQGVKRWLYVQSSKVIMLLLTALSFIAASFDYLMSESVANPELIGNRTGLLVGVATILYRYLVQPATEIVELAKIEKERRAAELAAQQPQPAPTILDTAGPEQPPEYLDIDTPNPEKPELVNPINADADF